MLRLERTRKLKYTLTAVGVVLSVIAVIALFRGMQPISSTGSAQAQLILFLMIGAALLALIAFLSALILHVLEKDISEELRYLEQKQQ